MQTFFLQIPRMSDRPTKRTAEIVFVGDDVIEANNGFMNIPYKPKGVLETSFLYCDLYSLFLKLKNTYPIKILPLFGRFQIF